MVGRSCAAILLGVGLLAAGCTSADDDGAESTTSASTTTEAVSGTSTTMAGTEPGPVDPVGPTRVGLITSLPHLAADWASFELPMSDMPGTDAWLAAVDVGPDGFTAVAYAWEAPPDNQIVSTWMSADGVEWTRHDEQIASGQNMGRVVSSGDWLIGIGSRTTRSGFEPMLWFGNGDGGWTTADLTGSGLDLSDVWLDLLATNDAGILISGGRSDYRPGPPLTIETSGYRIELDEYGGTYLVTEVASGRLVVSGEQSEFYAGSEDGQSVWDVPNDALITVVPWDVWETLYQTGSPLPIAVPVDDQPGTARSVEWDGLRITVDEENGRFDVVELNSGELVVAGLISDLYRGRPPSFVDAATGETVLSFSWDEWDELLNTAYQTHEDDHEEHDPESILLFSADGIVWSAQILDTADNTHIESVLSVDGEFLVTVVEHDYYDGKRTVYASSDGQSWATVERSGPSPLSHVEAGPDGAIAISYGGDRPTIAVSDDGLTWQTELYLVEQDDGRTGWFHAIGSGAMGRVALARFDPAPSASILTITVDGRTARFGAPGSAVEITDDSTGAVLLDADWQEMEEAAAAGERTYASYDDGVTSFWTADGSLAMTITDEQAQAAFEDQNRRFEEGTGYSLFSRVQNVWYETTLPNLQGASPEHLAVGDDTIVVGAVGYRANGSPDAGPNRLTVHVGRLR